MMKPADLQKNGSESGQSLVEVVVGLLIGAILITSATIVIASMLRSNVNNQKSQIAASFNQELFDKARSFGDGDWQAIYGLQKGTSTSYFIVASGTSLVAAQGRESVLDGDVTSGLVGRWGLDESAGTSAYDTSGKGNSGTLTGSPTATSSCPVGDCRNFSGSNYVSLPNSQSLELRTAITISAWVKPSVSTTSTQLSVAGKATEAYLHLSYGQSRFTVYAQTDPGGCNSGYCEAMGGTVLPANVWYHIVGTFDGANIRIYENGVLKTTRSWNTNIADTAAVPYIGGQLWGGFVGQIDDVRIYNRALAADEIKQLYGSSVFARSFYIQNVCRVNDASSTISGVSDGDGASSACTASGGYVDPSTQKVSASTQWLVRNMGPTSLTLSAYLTRWQNSIFKQDDWSGGPGQSGAINEPGQQFFASDNVDYSTSSGAITIEDLSQ